MNPCRVECVQMNREEKAPSFDSAQKRRSKGMVRIKDADVQPFEREHIRKVREYAPGCTLFLKRDGSFPLNAPCDIAAYGRGVRKTVKGGTGSGDVNVRHFVTVEEGL